MAGVFSLLIALFVSLVVNRIATMALMFTGLSRESAKFQARSAFSGVGFTTSEAECIATHPLRRRIIMLLMLLGNVGIATVMATVMVSLSSTFAASYRDQLLIFMSLCSGLVGLWLLFSSRWVERRMNIVIAWCLRKFTDLNVRDYVSLLQLDDGFSVSEMIVEPKHWLAGCELRHLRLSDEGILVLGIRYPDGSFSGIPKANDVIHSGEVLILYGDLCQVRELDSRRAGPAGDRAHLAAVERQGRVDQQDGVEQQGGAEKL